MKNIIKKLLLSIMVLSSTILTGCNYKMVDFEFNFTKVHTSFDGVNWKCYEITSWKDYSDGEQIQVEIKDYGIVLLSSNTSFLIKDKCPYCDNYEYNI